MIPQISQAPGLVQLVLNFLQALEQQGFNGDTATSYADRLSLSTDNSINLAKEFTNTHLPSTIYHLLQTNLGFAHGNNQGLKKINSKTRFVLFLNPDTIVEKNTFKKNKLTKMGYMEYGMKMQQQSKSAKIKKKKTWRALLCCCY